MKKQIFIIEHLEPRLWEWCLIEYKSISRIIGRDRVWFTNIKDGGKRLKKFGRIFRESVKKMDLKDVCVLDPDAKKILSSRDSMRFNYFIFGGILGDYPAKKRTKKELTGFVKNARVRNLGKKQMSTDNAVYVVNEICKGKEMNKLKFIEGAEIKINKIESVTLPFKYVSVNGKPFMSGEIKKYLKKHPGI